MIKESLREVGESSSGPAIERVELSDFRNYVALNVVLAPGLNIVFGPNAQGKTNLLEAVQLISSTRLLRGSKEAEAIREGAARGRASVTLARSGTELSVALEAGKRKIASLNKASLPRAADLLGRLPGVCVSSFDMDLVRGSPEGRRLFMDLELSQLSPSYLNHLAHYKRALEHRNALLRRAQEQMVHSQEFEPWESALALHGAAIRAARREFERDIRPLAAEVQALLGSGEGLAIAYESRDPSESRNELLMLMEAGRERDVARGTSSSGPHRDDLALMIDGRDARHFGSQGQQRSALLSLKLAAHRRQAGKLGHAPLLLLDDVFSDLDQGRRERLVSWILENATQAILTCTEPEAAGPALLKEAALFRVNEGRVASQGA